VLEKQMIWLIGFGVFILLVITIQLIQMNRHLQSIRDSVGALFFIRHEVKDQSEAIRAMFGTLKEIEKHTATTAAPEYAR
ncbi:UNVERIFIED_CONTAM: hypothetical protein DQE83_28925, partial [Escherichia coli]